MKNPNAFFAALAAGISIGAQWLLQRYAHVALSDYWKQTLDASAAAGILWIGNDGLKSALQRLWNGPKNLWTGGSGPSTPTS
jgi:hypothetical protein